MTNSGGTARRSRLAAGRVAVVDIGSNSVRLVVFDGLRRAFLPLFNEKVICGLGRGLQSSGRLSTEGVESALVNLARFAAMARAMEATEFHMVATAAVREAKNGPEFVAEVESLCCHSVHVLSGEEEARLAALGVLAGLPGADGIMGDLGGGSLELVALDAGRPGASETLALGPLRLMDATEGLPKRAFDIIESRLDQLGWLHEIKGRDFFAVGGAWRNLARLHLEQADYPLHVLHGYTLSRDEAAELARLVSGLGKRSLAQIKGVSRRRAETLPYAAALMAGLLRHFQPARVVLSAYGLREGLLFDRLPACQRERDPLIESAAELALTQGRFVDLGDALARWTDPLFPDEPPTMRRLRLATCHLSDLVWREHPDYRAEHALRRVLDYPFMGVGHTERVFMAVAVAIRYVGSRLPLAAEPLLTLLSSDELLRARVTGFALRLAYTLSAGVPSLLEKFSLENRDGRVRLTMPSDGSMPPGDIVERQLKALVEATGAKRGRIFS